MLGRCCQGYSAERPPWTPSSRPFFAICQEMTSSRPAVRMHRGGRRRHTTQTGITGKWRSVEKTHSKRQSSSPGVQRGAGPLKKRLKMQTPVFSSPKRLTVRDDVGGSIRILKKDPQRKGAKCFGSGADAIWRGSAGGWGPGDKVAQHCLLLQAKRYKGPAERYPEVQGSPLLVSSRGCW
jgi:hypothetical protein